MRTLLGMDAFDLLRKHRIPVASYKPVTSAEQASKLKVPCFLKVPSVLHKTEKKAVLQVNCKENLVAAYQNLAKKGQVVWQQMISGHEVIIGLKDDSTFGQIIMFGMGGIFTEVFKDVSFRAAPITKKEAREMTNEIKGVDLLKGVRGKAPINFGLLEKMLVNISKIKEDVSELDINPFIINSRIGAAVDVRVVLN